MRGTGIPTIWRKMQGNGKDVTHLEYLQLDPGHGWPASAGPAHNALEICPVLLHLPFGTRLQVAVGSLRKDAVAKQFLLVLQVFFPALDYLVQFFGACLKRARAGFNPGQSCRSMARSNTG